MEDSISNSSDRPSGGRIGADSGESRRNRLSDFHQNTKRAPGFYARAQAGIAGAPVFSGPAGEGKREWKAPPVKFGAGGGGRPGRLKILLLIMAGMAVASGLAALSGFFVGRERGKISASREIVERAKTLKRLPEKEARILNEAMTDLRAGRAEAAMESLRSLRAKYPQAGSLSYLAALAALQAGQFVAAENLAADSIKAGQRLSDSLAVMSMLERQKAGGGSEPRAEELLRAAITADAANPAPHLELAALLRREGRREEARREIKAAQALLNPVDAHAVSGATLALMDLEDSPDDKLPEFDGPPRNITETLVAANTAMRKGEFAKAAGILKAANAMTSPEVFIYLMSDPAFRNFRYRPELAEFFP